MEAETQFKLFAVGMVVVTITLAAILAYEVRKVTQGEVEKVQIPEVWYEADTAIDQEEVEQ